MINFTKRNEDNYKPLFFRLEIPAQKKDFEDLIENTSGLLVYDELLSQVEEYVKSVNPTIVFNKDSLRIKALEHIGSTPLQEYGAWVFYPWSKRLVHILDEDEFVAVRTNRNQYKITPEEKAILSTKKIGVIGLSVGQSIALTLAMERIFGELRLADFDLVELSNLNRIRTGVHNLNVLKVVTVAREIAEIDPYLKVNCFTSGLTEKNMDAFFLDGGKLDVCVEVCDGLEVKIQSRYKARELGVPVVMNSSDKGTTDIERYDLNRKLPILHGLIDHLDLTKVKEARTNEEKVPYLLPMLGVDTATTRLRASMLEIQQTITTWPQLASGVVLGGAIVTDVCRRILLNQLHSSARYFVDLEELIADPDRKPYVEEPLNIKPSLTNEQMLKLIETTKTEPDDARVELPKETVATLVAAAGDAPSGANSQTWKWAYKNRTLYMFFDDVLRPDLLDCRRTTMITGLGAAAENLVLKAHLLGFEVKFEKFKITDTTELVGIFTFFQKNHKTNCEAHVCDELGEFIPKRVSNRMIFEETASIEKTKLDHLVKIARTIPGADLIILNDREKLSELAEITARMDRIRYLSKGGHNDFRGEARWTIEEANQTRNGISFLEVMDLTPTELAGFYVSKNWQVVEHLAKWKLGSAFGKIQRKWINSSAAVGLITVPEFTTDNFFEGGRAMERVWLAATKENIQSHPPSLSTLIFNTVQYGPENSLPEEMRSEALDLLSRFNKLFSIGDETGKVLLMRFFIGPEPKYRALRYPVEQILNYFS